MAEAQTPMYRVREAFSFDHGGRAYVMRTGDIVGADHPAFKGREALFEEINAESGIRDYSAGTTGIVETATANPGERRTVRTPKGA